MSDFTDGRLLALTVTLQHIMRHLEDKGILRVQEREFMLGDIRRYFDRNSPWPACSEAHSGVAFTIGCFEPIAAGYWQGDKRLECEAAHAAARDPAVEELVWQAHAPSA